LEPEHRRQCCQVLNAALKNLGAQPNISDYKGIEKAFKRNRRKGNIKRLDPEKRQRDTSRAGVKSEGRPLSDLKKGNPALLGKKNRHQNRPVKGGEGDPTHENWGKTQSPRCPLVHLKSRGKRIASLPIQERGAARNIQVAAVRILKN